MSNLEAQKKILATRLENSEDREKQAENSSEKQSEQLKTGELTKEVREYFSAIGKRGAKNGGQARWKGVGKKERSKIARNAVNARWGKRVT